MTNQHTGSRAFTRRGVIGSSIGAVAAMAIAPRLVGASATPEPSTAAGWSYTDVLGKTVTLPQAPVRIAANLVTAAALWDLGIKAVAVFDWTASAYPDGDHIAWGNIDATAVANVGDADGNILPEDLLVAKPDIILTLTFDAADPEQTGGVPPKIADAVERIAPVLVVTDMDSTELQLQRLVDLAASLGADLTLPAIVEAKTAYEAKTEEFRTVAAEKAELTSLFINCDAAELYVGGPQGVAELRYLSSLGLSFANDGSAAAGDFWETLSSEQAQLYPADVIYTDVYSTLRTAEDLQEVPVFASLPAVAAGQVGDWKRDFPVSYAGLTDFLEVILSTLRTAEKVTAA